MLSVVAALSLAGCSASHGTTSSAPPSSSPPASLPAPAPSNIAPSATVDNPTTAPASPRPVPTGTLVDFARQGGLAGVSDRLVIRDNGAFTLTRLRPRVVSRAGRLTSAELAGLRQALQQAGFSSLPKVEKGDGTDVFTYSVLYDGYQIVAQDGAMAPSLRPVVSALSNLLAKYSA